MKTQVIRRTMNSVYVWLALLLTVLFCLVQAPVAHAAGRSPVQGAEALRSTLFEVQMALAGDPVTAAATMETVGALTVEPWFVTLTAVAPTAAATVQQALTDAQTAVDNGDGPAFAAARAQVWTALLSGAQTIVLQAVAQGDVTTAREWLLVREFRQATRFSRPNADATLALVALETGQISAEDAANAIRADLYDTYQARLTEALRNLTNADEQGFALRRAEHAASAQGYFAILQPAYLEQRQKVATDALRADLAALTAATLANASTAELQAQLATVSAALDGFRAAPLLPAEQVQRAGQLLRFLNLVGVEYSRGVRNGEVTSDLEIREAVTFFTGARAAFDDLRDLLAARDGAQTTALVTLFTDLEAQINSAVTRQDVADPAAVDLTVTAINDQLHATMPEAWLRRDNSADFDVIQTSLDNMEAAVASGDYALAESARVDAYAILESGPEARIQAFAAQYKLPIEDLFWYGQGEEPGLAYLISQKADLAAVKQTRAALTAQLDAAELAVSGNSSPFALATNAAVIVFREGLEAVLILASLMAGFKSLEQRRLRKPMWWGAGVAGLASILTWLLAQGLLTSLARYGEALEAIVSLIAIGVLLLITNWFFHQNYWTGHIAGLHAKKKGLIGGAAGQWLGLAMLGFTSVYREGFETVLFLQALVLEGGIAIVVLGTLIGLAATLLIGLIIFRLQVRLPYKKMLIVTGIFIGVVLLTMVGNTVHVLQLVGWLPLHPIRFLTLPYWLGMWFGLYATWEGIVLQVMAGAFVIGSYFVAENMQKRTIKQRAQRNSGAVQGAASP
ncbi:MAG TPA: FTR1 family protein [Caldilineaceae bacterium]|nr:FTR1 family protein [Caldilineaceae bacterium]